MVANYLYLKFDSRVNNILSKYFFLGLGSKSYKESLNQEHGHSHFASVRKREDGLILGEIKQTK